MRTAVRITKLFLQPVFGNSSPAGCCGENQSYNAECRGTVQSGHDLLGNFGPPGADLAGSTFDAGFVFALHRVRLATCPNDKSARASCGIEVMTGSLTINGRPHAWHGGHSMPESSFGNLPTVSSPLGFVFQHDAMREYLEDFTGRLLFQITTFEHRLSAQDHAGGFSPPINATTHAQGLFTP